MRKGRKFLAWLLALCLFVPLFANIQTAEAKAAKIRTGAQSIGVNCSCKIDIGDKVKGAAYSFASSNAKIASVNKNGKVTGKDYGTAKITVSETKGKTTKKLGTVKITVEKCALDTAVRQGVCAFGRGDGSGVFAGGKGGKTVKSLAQIEGLLAYQNPKAVYQYVSDNKKLLDINAKGKIVGVKGSGTAKITVSEIYNGKTRKIGSFKVQVAPDKKIIAYMIEPETSDSIWFGTVYRYVYDMQGREIARKDYIDGVRDAVYENEYDSHGNLAVERRRMSIYGMNGVSENRYKYTYENDRPVSMKFYSYLSYTSVDPEDESRVFYETEELQDTFTCTVDKKGRITALEGKHSSKSYTYDEKGNCTLIRERDNDMGTGWDTEITYTADGQIAERRVTYWDQSPDRVDIGVQRETVERYLFDSKGYAISCEYYYQSEQYESQPESYPVEGMDLSEYFARLRADQTMDYDKSAIVGRWKFVAGIDISQPAYGVLEFFADGRVIFYSYDIWSEPDADGVYPLEEEGQEMHYEISLGILTFSTDESEVRIKGHYLLTGDTLLYLVEDHT